MSDLRELYQEVILDHGKKPRNFHAIDGTPCAADGHNPLCGDRVRVFVKCDGDRIDEIAFEGAGCAISIASASMMTEALRGKSIEQATELFGAFHELVTGRSESTDVDSRLGKLQVFSGVQEFPVRVKCATLAWHTFRSALERGAETATTEQPRGE